MQLNRGVQGPGDGSEHRYPEPFDPAVRTRTIPIFQWKYSRERALGTPQISPGRRFESFLCRSLCIFTGFAVCLEALWFLSPLPIPPGLRLRATQSASSLRVTELKRWCALSPPRSNLPPRPSNSQRAEFFLELFVARRRRTFGLIPDHFFRTVSHKDTRSFGDKIDLSTPGLFVGFFNIDSTVYPRYRLVRSIGFFLFFITNLSESLKFELLGLSFEWCK